MEQSPKEKFWNEKIADYEKSGLSRDEFCRQNNLSRSAFGYWSAKKSAAQNHSSADFVKLRDSNLPIVVRLSESVRIEFPGSIPPALICDVALRLSRM